jgi:hypothetical protein
MGEIWLGILLVTGIDLVLIGLVAAVVLCFTRAESRAHRRQARAFAEAVAHHDFEQAEAAAGRAFAAAAAGGQARRDRPMPGADV